MPETPRPGLGGEGLKSEGVRFFPIPPAPLRLVSLWAMDGRSFDSNSLWFLEVQPFIKTGGEWRAVSCTYRAGAFGMFLPMRSTKH